MNELFQCADDEEAKKLQRCEKIRVKRQELGKLVYAPNAYEPSTLETLEQLHQIYGGGDYMIELRDSHNNFLKNCRLQLPGKPKSLMLDEQEEQEEERRRPPQQSYQQPPDAMSLMVQMMMAQQAQTTQILTAVLSRGDNGTDKLVARSQALEDRARSEHNDFLKTLLETASTRAAAQPTAGGQEGFIAGIEFAQGMFAEMMAKQGQGGDANPMDFMSSLQQFMTGLTQLGQQVAGNGGPAVPPNGTAH